MYKRLYKTQTYMYISKYMVYKIDKIRNKILS